MDTLDVIIDQSHGCRFNRYPYAGPYTCLGLFVTLPNKVSIKITSLNRYIMHGVISHKEISKWISDNGYERKRGEPISQFSFEFKEIDGIHYYTIKNYLGQRMPHSRNIV